MIIRQFDRSHTVVHSYYKIVILKKMKVFHDQVVTAHVSHAVSGCVMTRRDHWEAANIFLQ